MITLVEIIDKPIDLAKYFDVMNNQKHGAQNVFLGKVRDNNMGKDVLALEYDVQTTIAINKTKELCQKARAIIEDTLDIMVVMRYGHLKVGDISTLIIVSAKHRNEAFLGCRFMIEEIKKVLPIWKNEHYKNGETSWLRGVPIGKNAN